jgi:DNA gyrase/topoisomerase IV subunit A
MSVLGSASVIALLTLTYTIWRDSKVDSIAYGETKALLSTTTDQLKEMKAENTKLTNETAELNRTIDGLRQSLLTEETDNRYNKRLLEESLAKTKAQDIQLEQISRLVKADDPCSPIRLQIAEIEKILRRPSYDAFAPQGEQRDQLAVNLNEKYKTLNACFGSK